MCLHYSHGMKSFGMLRALARARMTMCQSAERRAPALPIVCACVCASSFYSQPHPHARHTPRAHTHVYTGRLLMSFAAPHFAAAFGWRAAFGVQGGVLLMCAAYWWRTVDSSPDVSRVPISAAERAKLPTMLPSSNGVNFPLWLLGHAPVWGIIAVHTAGNYGYTMVNSWTNTFFDDVLGLSPAAAAPYLAMPPLLGLVSRIMLSYAVPWLQKTYAVSDLVVRRCSQWVASTGVVACVLVFCHTTSAPVATAALCVRPLCSAALPRV